MGDAAMLKSIFHESAVVNGFVGSHIMLGSPKPFFDYMEGLAAKGKSFKSAGFNYKGEITSLNVYGNVATAAVVEYGYGGNLAFTDNFHLMKVDGQWKIMSKIFTGHKHK